MGPTGIPKPPVSKLCKDIDERVGAFLDRPLSGEWPYLWLDATYLRQREGGRIVSVAAIIAVACDAEGRREIVGLHIGPSEGSIIRLIGVVLLEANDEWQMQHRYMGVEAMGEMLNPPPTNETLQLPPKAA
jgi:transposase-like protein